MVRYSNKSPQGVLSWKNKKNIMWHPSYPRGEPTSHIRMKKTISYSEKKAFQMGKLLLICRCSDKDQGPVVQSVVSLMSSLRVISLTVLADLIYNVLIFFAEKM